MKKRWQSPDMTISPMDLSELGDVNQLSDAELKIKLEQAGYKFQKKYQASSNYIYRKIDETEVLISVGSNIANFNGDDAIACGFTGKGCGEILSYLLEMVITERISNNRDDLLEEMRYIKEHEV